MIKKLSNGERYDAWARATDVPMLVLALGSIAVLIVEETGPPAWSRAAALIDWVIWAAFAFDLLVRGALTTQSFGKFIRSHLLDVAIVVLAVLPIFRPLRALRSARVARVLRVTRVGAYAARSWQLIERVWRGAHGGFVGISMLTVLFLSTIGVWSVERHSDGPIQSLADSLWWSLVTITTVGYGDFYPVTPEGKGIAVVLMLTGIASFGIVSANLAATFLKSAETERLDNAALGDRIDQLERALRELIQHLEDEDQK